MLIAGPFSAYCRNFGFETGTLDYWNPEHDAEIIEEGSDERTNNSLETVRYGRYAARIGDEEPWETSWGTTDFQTSTISSNPLTVTDPNATISFSLAFVAGRHKTELVRPYYNWTLYSNLQGVLVEDTIILPSEPDVQYEREWHQGTQYHSPEHPIAFQYWYWHEWKDVSLNLSEYGVQIGEKLTLTFTVSDCNSGEPGDTKHAAYLYIDSTYVDSPFPPEPPIPISPPDGTIEVRLTPTLIASNYSHLDGAPHINSQWQISKNIDFTDIDWDSGINYPATTQITVPSSVQLDSETKYYWRIRYRSNPWSNWSPVWSFTTGRSSTMSGNEGQIVYVKNIVRDNGLVTTTGELYIKNLETGVERAITNYTTAGTGAILNPQLTSDGANVVYTYSPDPTTTDFDVYIVDVNALVDGADGMVEGLAAGNKKYAALSPNYDGEKGLLVYTREAADRTELWVYDFATEANSQIKSLPGLFIKHPVFLSQAGDNDATIAYIGIQLGYQDIMLVDAGGGSDVNLTNNNISGYVSPEYTRIQASTNNTDVLDMPDPYLIYGKRIWQQDAYGDWDIYKMNSSDGTEVPLTDTDDYDELAPAFFGNHDTMPALAYNDGQMFYEADLLGVGDVAIWQANYSDSSNITNASRLDRTAGDDYGLVSWSVLPDSAVDPESGYVSLDETMFVYTDGSKVHRADSDGSNDIQLPGSGATDIQPSLARNGGTIVYTKDDDNSIRKMIHTGTIDTELESGGSGNLKEATISPDGRWVAYVRDAGTSQYEVVAELLSGDTIVATVIDNNGGAHYVDISAPYFNPDSTQIVYAVQGSGANPNEWDIKVLSVTVNNDVSPSTVTSHSCLDKITNTTHLSEKQPSFSNDGSKIIYVSDERGDGSFSIYTMNVDGSDHNLVVEGTGLAYPIYGPVYDSDYGNTSCGADRIAYLKDGAIYTGYVYGCCTENPGYASGTNPVTGESSTTIVPDTSSKFGWGKKRVVGTVVAQRYMPAKAGVNIEMKYNIVVDVDETNLPYSFTLTEVYSDGVAETNAPTATVDGVGATVQLFYDTPSAGLVTMKLFFDAGNNGGVEDHLVRVTMEPDTQGASMVYGEVSFNLSGSPVSSEITGNALIDVNPPYIPVDIYDDEGAKSPNGVIEDFDLLYAIDAWIQDAQLQGYGAGWPEDIDNWNGIIMAVIDIWADTVTQGCYWTGTANATVGSTQTKAGEYTFIGDKVMSDGVPETYCTCIGATGATDEMYWTQGEWLNP